MPNDRAGPAFDLTAQPWIPVLRKDRTHDVLSLCEVFRQASSIQRIVGDIPTQEFALLRLLLAILHDVVDGPADLEDWQELWDGGVPLDDVTGYLAEHRDRFDLLHPQAPFFQTPDLRTDTGEIFSLDRIVADVPNGNRFFTMRACGADRIDFAEAARWLVHAHAFDTSGIKTGAVGDDRVNKGKVYALGVGWAGNLGGVYVEGGDLLQTLLLNLVAFDTMALKLDPERDRPAWRHDPSGAGQLDALQLSRRPAGLRDLYTWQSRRVRLHFDDAGVHGVVLGYGDPLLPQNKHDREPMTAWRRSEAQAKKLGMAEVYMPLQHDVNRAAWRGLGALIADRPSGSGQRQEAASFLSPRVLGWTARLTVEGDLPRDFLITARLIGAVYGTQQSVIDEVIDDAVEMPVVLLHEQDRALGQAAIDAVADAEAAVTALGRLAADLALASGIDSEPAKATARSLGFGMLDHPFRTWLSSLRPGDSPQDKRLAWQGQACKIVSWLGADLLREAGDAAWAGRVLKLNGQQEIWLDASLADLFFRSRLAKALPGPARPAEQPDEAPTLEKQT